MERKEAIAAGLNTYSTGRPCKNGHNSYRYTRSGTCNECINNMNAAITDKIKAIQKVISRSEARAAGLTRYKSNRPCTYGHDSERIVSTGECCACAAHVESIEKETASVVLMMALDMLPDLKLFVDALVSLKLPHLDVDRVNPALKFHEKAGPAGLVRVRVPLDDIQTARDFQKATEPRIAAYRAPVAPYTPEQAAWVRKERARIHGQIEEAMPFEDTTPPEHYK